MSIVRNLPVIDDGSHVSCLNNRADVALLASVIEITTHGVAGQATTSFILRSAESTGFRTQSVLQAVGWVANQRENHWFAPVAPILFAPRW